MKILKRTLIGAGGIVVTLVWLRCGPLPAGLLDWNRDFSTEIFDRHGGRLYEARSGLGTRGDTLDAASLTPTLALATIAAEDTRFRRHYGLDPVAIARAAW